MGDGYEPHVDETDGGLVYSLPVDSGFMNTSFSFDLRPPDLTVLLANPYRREMLAVIAHTVLQKSMGPDPVKVSQGDFDTMVRRVLHSGNVELERFADAIDREHNIRVRIFVAQALARRSTDPSSRHER